jgi:hypothetical protein
VTWRWVDRQAEARETARQHARRALHVYEDEDGTVVVRGRLEPEVGALFLKALGAARETLYLRHWAQGGPTTLANLALLCRRHHRAMHEDGYHVERRSDGTLRFRRADGRPLPDVPLPPLAAVPADPVQALRVRHAAQGLRLHARTARPSWLGQRLDLGWAIDVLHPLANPRRVSPPPRGERASPAPGSSTVLVGADPTPVHG